MIFFGIFYMMLLANFQSIRPSYETAQAETIEWLIQVHGEKVREKLSHVGCKPEHIGKRGHVLALKELPTKESLSSRSKIYQQKVEAIFEQYYPPGSNAPEHLIHVSCTGYVSPSGAQAIVSKQGWNTTVTHAYHMGCYGAFPAIRIASGLLKNQIDIVHTEICSLHTNPFNQRLDQLVSQSLFADGFMKYSVVHETDQPHLKVVSLQEEIIPHSLHAMSWNVAEYGFEMSLAKEIPVLIARYLPGYLNRLCNKSTKKPLFAVHPGGPKILNHIQKLLSLSDDQMSYSFQILKDFGNMSSATIPHIWQKILEDPKIPSLTPIISMAFGPGLTISGGLLEKA